MTPAVGDTEVEECAAEWLLRLVASTIAIADQLERLSCNVPDDAGEHVRRALSGIEHDLLPGLDRARLALLRRGWAVTASG
ncbi:hypothetical protein CFN78_25750 [Amycolatopsis antarctica]|uniref:Uncharacterized protein n=1 Tax=Amycolatopsis antarctica TaxID=1854586 RepID=A0A263CW10_9PSEU|nr:hypothetical protein [Amycolatopsis antarctica]OZM70330.1 hypothetical protein CFN78_25750 [Amycolatopsis antarctica]